MSVTIKEISAVERSIEIAIPQADLKAPFDKKVNQYRKQLQLKGFRQGQVPRNIVLARYGEAIRQETVDELVNQTLTEELKKAKIEPVSPLKVNDFKDDKEQDITFTVSVEVDPEIEIQNYDNLGISVPDIVISEAEIKDELDRMLQMWSKDESVDRKSSKGDVVVGEYVEVIIDGETQTLPEQKEFRSLLGESASPGFDEGLVGVEKGETKEINFVYPNDHKNEIYRGKTAQFKVEITDVREIIAPVMDEEFFKNIGLKDEAELTKSIQESLYNNKKNTVRNKAIDEAIDKLIDLNPFEVPPSRVKSLIKHTLQKNNPTDQDFEPTEEQIEGLSPEAIREIKKHRILEFIVNKENLKVTQDMVDNRLKELAIAYQIDFDSLKKHFRQSGRIASLREELRFEVAADFIVGIKKEQEN